MVVIGSDDFMFSGHEKLVNVVVGSSFVVFAFHQKQLRQKNHFALAYCTYKGTEVHTLNNRPRHGFRHHFGG